jgi:squalene-hopene/tetraprenyl-beta-curcumene cyclase
VSHAPVRAPPLLLASAVSPATHAECTASNAKLATSTTQGDPKARAAAQKGLDYLAHAARQWQDEHQCYGCHVQAVTLEAMTVGKSHQYTVKAEDLNAIVFGMTDISGGVHGPHGLTVGNEVYLPETSKSFGGSAFAHFDERVGPKLRKELEQTATELLAAQNTDGSVRASYNNAPIVIGEIQSTAQALTTWRQVFARTADTRWLVPIRKSEEWLTVQAKRLSDGGGPLQDVDHAIIGLHAAGRESGDKLVTALGRVVEKMQNSDGGFGYNKGEPSNAFATGQALYALRLAGHSDGDTGIKKGTSWLLQQQQADGGWGGSGFGKAEAMWAVLGLVSMDMISVDLAGLVDGQHVDGNKAITARAADNTGASVKKLEVFVDDVKVTEACGAELASTFDATKLDTGPHLVDVVATGDSGKQSRKRIVVYAGDAWLQELATRFESDKTIIGFRNLAADDMKATVKITIVDDKKKEVATTTLKANEGAMSWAFDGKQGGRFTAKVALVDASGKVRDTEEVLFTHDTYEAQKNSFAEVAGQVQMGDDMAANTEVELVDKNGNVVQRAVTTRSGQYRFQDVDDGKYKVRVKKKGFKAWEADLAAPKAAEAAAPAAALQRE